MSIYAPNSGISVLEMWHIGTKVSKRYRSPSLHQPWTNCWLFMYNELSASVLLTRLQNCSKFIRKQSLN